MHKQTGYEASLFVEDACVEQVKYRLARQVPPGSARKSVRLYVDTRFGTSEFRVLATDFDALLEFAKELAKPGKFAPSFFGPWRIGYRQLEVSPDDILILNTGTMVECFDGVTLPVALARAEGATPTVLVVVRQDVDEADILRAFHQSGQLTGNELYYTEEEWIDIHFGEKWRQSGASYERHERQLTIASESVALLMRTLTSFQLAPVFGEANWIGARVPVIWARGERPTSTHEGFRTGSALLVNRFLDMFVAHERGDPH